MKKIESGRSMIEMLGVLAIIGVLSIGGLAAYSSAMTRNKANNILDYATKAGMNATEKKAAGKTDCTTTVYGMTAPDGASATVSSCAYTITVTDKALANVLNTRLTAINETINSAIDNVSWALTLQ